MNANLGKRDVLWLAAVALVVMTLFQAYRATFPLVRSLAESTVYIVGGATAIAVFAVTMLAGFLGRRVRTRPYAYATVGAFGLLYAIEVLVARPTVYVMLATCFFGVLALGALLAMPRAPRGSLAAAAILVGGGMDAITKTLFATWDPIWQAGLLPLLWTLVPTIAMVAVAAVVIREPEDGSPRTDSVPMLAMAGFGGWLALVFIALGNVAMVAANGNVSLWLASVVVLLGWTLALVALNLRLPDQAVWGLGAVALLAAVFMPVLSGLLVIVVSLLGMAAGGPLLAATLRGREPAAKGELPAGAYAGGGMLAVGLGAGIFGFTVIQFLYQIHYAMNLPVWNNWLLLLPGLWLMLAAARGPQRPGNDEAPLIAAVVPAAGVVVVPGYLALTAGAIASTSAGQIDIVNYNIHEGVSNNGPGAPTVGLDLEAIAQTIETTNPNVVALQEVGRGWAMSGYTDEALWLQRRLGMDLTYGAAADRQFGNAVLTSMPVTSGYTVDLGQGTGPMKRSAVGAQLETDFGDVWVWSTHLQHNEQDGTFNEQDRIDQLDTWLQNRPSAGPTIVAGDFNAEPGAPPLVHMEEAGFVNGQYVAGIEVAGSRPEITYQGPQSDASAAAEEHLDYIFATTDLAFRAFGIGDSQASDHRPLNAVLAAAQ